MNDLIKSKKRLLICDWDCTLAEPIERRFYATHRVKTKEAIARHFNLDNKEIDAICETLDTDGIRIEKLLSSPEVSGRFNLHAKDAERYKALKESLESIDPKGWFEPNPEMVDSLRDLRSDYRIVVLSNSPQGLINAIGREIGYDMDKDFDAFYTMTASTGAPKFVDPVGVFQKIVDNESPEIAQSWSIGDTAKIDLNPAQDLGFNTALVDNLNRNIGDSDTYDLYGHTVPVLREIKARMP